jgi:hypothetical protein
MQRPPRSKPATRRGAADRRSPQAQQAAGAGPAGPAPHARPCARNPLQLAGPGPERLARAGCLCRQRRAGFRSGFAGRRRRAAAGAGRRPGDQPAGQRSSAWATPAARAAHRRAALDGGGRSTGAASNWCCSTRLSTPASWNRPAAWPRRWWRRAASCTSNRPGLPGEPPAGLSLAQPEGRCRARATVAPHLLEHRTLHCGAATLRRSLARRRFAT